MAVATAIDSPGIDHRIGKAATPSPIATPREIWFADGATPVPISNATAAGTIASRASETSTTPSSGGKRRAA